MLHLNHSGQKSPPHYNQVATVDASLKTDGERILRALGISTTEAINLFLNRVRLSKGIPFSVQMSDDEFRSYLAECSSEDEAISSEEANQIKLAQNEIKENKVVSFVSP